MSSATVVVMEKALPRWSGKPRGHLGTGMKLIRCVPRHLVARVQLSKYFYQLARPDTSSHFHPLLPVFGDQPESSGTGRLV